MHSVEKYIGIRCIDGFLSSLFRGLRFKADAIVGIGVCLLTGDIRQQSWEANIKGELMVNVAKLANWGSDKHHATSRHSLSLSLSSGR